VSYIAWHTRDEGTAELRGSEYAHARGVCTDLALGLLRAAIAMNHKRLISFLHNPPDYVRKEPEPAEHMRWASGLKTWLNVDGEVSIDGETMSFGEMAMNTAITMNRPLRLLAWMAGMSENHGYFERPEQSALIEAISEGLDARILRADQGWDRVYDLLERNVAAGGSAVVWSFSVAESWPDVWMLDDRPDPDDDDAVAAWEERWYLFGESDQERREAGKPTSGEIWDLCMEKLRAQDWPVPLDLEVEQGYRSGKTTFDFLAQLS
jgi:hypothetical protein